MEILLHHEETNADQQLRNTMRFIFPSILITICSSITIAHAQEKSLLWEISGNGLEQPSYLFGTVHMISRDDFFVRAEVDSVFAQCDQVAFEIDLDDIGQLQSIQSWLTLPEDLTLDAIMPQEDYTKIKTYFADSMQLNLNDYNSLKPFALYQEFISWIVGPEQESFEIYFLTKCISAEKKVLGLEPLSDEFRIFDDIRYQTQIDWLLMGIDSTASIKSGMQELIQAYLDEDLTKLELLSKDDPVFTGEFEDALLTDRNQKWVEKIVPYVKEMPTFIAVGAAHLPGENGLISLLESKGFILQPVLKK